MIANVSNYVLIDAGKLNIDIKIANGKFDDGISFRFRMRENGICETTVLNSIKNFESGFCKFDLSEYEKCEKYGVIRKTFLKKICSVFNLKEENYKLKKKEYNEDLTKEDIEELENELLKPFGEIDIKELEYEVIRRRQIKELLKKRAPKIIEEDKKSLCEKEILKQFNNIGKIQMKIMEYLKEISEQMKKLNDKWE